MATKSNTLKKKSSSFKFRWWMALVLVSVVTILGIVVLRYSHAGTKTNFTAANFVGCPNYLGAPTQTIKAGDKGPCVEYWQSLMNEYNYGSLVNGVNFKGAKQTYFLNYDAQATFDDRTLLYTKAFQSKNNLTRDGIVGPQTWSAMIKACYINLVCESPQAGGPQTPDYYVPNVQ